MDKHTLIHTTTRLPHSSQWCLKNITKARNVKHSPDDGLTSRYCTRLKDRHHLVRSQALIWMLWPAFEPLPNAHHAMSIPCFHPSQNKSCPQQWWTLSWPTGLMTLSLPGQPTFSPSPPVPPPTPRWLSPPSLSSSCPNHRFHLQRPRHPRWVSKHRSWLRVQNLLSSLRPTCLLTTPSLLPLFPTSSGFGSLLDDGVPIGLDQGGGHVWTLTTERGGRSFWVLGEVEHWKGCKFALKT